MINPEIFPAVFVTDFGPMPAVESDDYTQALARLGKTLPKPRAIVIMSGHWEARGFIAVTASEKPGIVHDYSGFPDEFYRLDYACPGDPGLASQIVRLLSENGIKAKLDAKRPLDHGAWVPLSRIYPNADIPVVQLTTDAENAEENFRIGKILSPLREKGILLIGSGAVSHNLRLALVHRKDDAPDDWAVRFDGWLQEKLDQTDTAALFGYQKNAPFAGLAVPTAEHFNPIFFVLGASGGAKPTHLYRSVRYGNGIMRVIIYK